MPSLVIVVATSWVAAVAPMSPEGVRPPAHRHAVPCVSGTIKRIDVVNHSLFSPAELADRRFAWALHVVNRAHIRTREAYIRRALLVSDGACYDREAVAASERNLRDLNFIARAEAVALQLPDSTWTIRVETWDEWSLHVGLGVDPDRQYRYTGFGLDDDNLLGLGVVLGYWTERNLQRDDVRWSLGTTRVLGTRTVASASGGTTRTGQFFRQTIGHPFYSEASAYSIQASLEYEDGELSWRTGAYDGLSNVTLPVGDRRGSMVARRRIGVPGQLSVFGLELHTLVRTGSGRPQQVIGGRFSSAVPAADSLVAELGGFRAPRSFARAGATVGLRRLRFTQAKGLDLISSTQNVALGSELLVTVGRTLATWGTAPTDSYTWIEAFGADTAGPLLGTASFRADASLSDAAVHGQSRWRDLRLSGRALLYVSRRTGAPLTFVTGARFDLRTNTDEAWQSSLGGETALRGYRTDEVPTGSNVVLFAEQRINLPIIHPAFDLGFAGFTEAGRGWRSGIPFAINTGWRTDVGAAVRIGFPAGTGAVARFEVARPVGPDRGRGGTFRIYWSSTFTSR